MIRMPVRAMVKINATLMVWDKGANVTMQMSNVILSRISKYTANGTKTGLSLSLFVCCLIIPMILQKTIR